VCFGELIIANKYSFAIAPVPGAAASMENPPPQSLPDDIMIAEIFSKLLAKSLLLCRCVSKSWHGLISKNKNLPPTMAGLFYRNNCSNKIEFISLGTRTYVDNTSIDTTLSFLPQCNNLNIVDSCNGLLLLTAPDCLYVCNPATKKYATVPKPPTQPMLLALGFDPRRSPHYEIVSFPQDELEDGESAHIKKAESYNSSTGKWKWRDNRYWRLEHVCFARTGFAFLDGIIHTLDLEDGATFIMGENVWDVVEDRPGVDIGIGLETQFLGHCGQLMHQALIASGELFVWVAESRTETYGIRYRYVLKHRNSVRAIVDQLQPAGDLVLEDDDDQLRILAFHSDFDVIFLRLQDKLLAYHLTCGQSEVICDNFEGDRPCFAYSPCYSEDLALETCM